MVAEPGATLKARLGFAPSSVEVTLLDRAGAIVYSRALTVSQDISWAIPNGLPVTLFLEITAERPDFPQDSAAYLARLSIAS